MDDECDGNHYEPVVVAELGAGYVRWEKQETGVMVVR